MEMIYSVAAKTVTTMLTAVFTSLSHNWAALLIAILMACAIKVYVNNQKLTQFLLRKSRVSVVGAVLLGTFTPFCACGTTAVVLGMLSTTLPWGPIMAFLTSSPLMSPDGFVLIAGMISLRFAIALTIASLIIGLGSGFLTLFIEKKTNYLANQNRFTGEEKPAPSCACPDSTPAADLPVPSPVVPFRMSSCGYSGNVCYFPEDAGLVYTEPRAAAFFAKWKIDAFFQTLWSLGFRTILLNFVIFIAIGSLINLLVPNTIIQALFGGDHIWSVPLASVIGLPLYVTTESATPVIESILQSGASEGSMLAFIITGSATSAWVIAGLNTFMRKRAILLYVGFVLAGGILAGYLYNVILALSH